MESIIIIFEYVIIITDLSEYRQVRLLSNMYEGIKNNSPKHPNILTVQVLHKDFSSD